jgi:hypothetical protein
LSFAAPVFLFLFAKFTVSAFKKEMKRIYSSYIDKDTLDEALVAHCGKKDKLGRL